MYQAEAIGIGIPLPSADNIISAEVFATFSEGFYVRTVFGEIFAIGNHTIPAGPIHLTLKGTAPAPEISTPISISCESIKIGTKTVSLTTGTRFIPRPPSVVALNRITPFLSTLFDDSHIPADLKRFFPNIKRLLSQGQLTDVILCLQGRGAGLTPCGDDMLAGIFLYQTWATKQDPHLLHTINTLKTTDLSKAFLNWAVKGYSIQPIHDLITALVTLTDRSHQFHQIETVPILKTILNRIRNIGHTSGHALLLGLGLAALTNVDTYQT